MKNYFKYIAMSALVVAMAACSDKDGEGEFTWEGSQNPENTSYRNPVWEPSLAGGTVFKAASNYVGLSQETQWAAGLDYAVPAIQSANIMNWSSNQQAFSYPVVTDEIDEETGEVIITPGSYPDWLTGKITHVTADFAKTINGANYWMIYASEADNAFGAASSSSGMGPYTDLGKFMSAEDLGVETLRYPHFSVIASTNYYLGYTTENGSYIQQLNLRRGQAPAKRGSATQVSGPEFQNICIFRVSNTDFYLFGTVTTGSGSEIRYARATKITGPYVDKNGVALTDGSNGELLVEGGTEYAAPCNPMHMFVSEAGLHYLAYNASAITKPTMPSGYDRKPLFINPVAIDEEGWFTEVIVPQTGWTSPRFD